MSEKPGRYQRSFAGLVGAMIVTVLAILVFVGFRSLFRDNDAVEREPVDYAGVVGSARDAGFDVVAPRSLPAGWTATSVDIDRTRDKSWSLGVLTDAGKFIGIQQADDSLTSLLETYVDEDATEGEPTTLPNDVAPEGEWQSFTDDGGDTAYAVELGDEVLLVYGSAPDADIRAYIALLEQ